MEKIVLDLEFCKIKSKAFPEEFRICNNEIIQIGAVRLNDNNEIIDEFDMLVKPQFSRVNKQVSELTHITNDMLTNQLAFNEVMTHFVEWVGDKACMVYTWSLEDLRQLKKEAQLKNFWDATLEMMFMNWYDLQKIFGEKIGAPQQVSLTNALRAGDIQFEGIVHTACADAVNTAKIYQVMEDEIKFDKLYKTIKDMFTPSEELTFSLGNIISGLQFNDFAVV